MPTDSRPLASPLRRVGAVWVRHTRVYVNHLLANSAGPFIEPLLFLLAIGMGLGAYVKEMEGLPYLVFLAPAQALIAAVYAAIFETTYGTYFRMVIDRNYDSIVATPVSAREVFWGELLYVGTKGFAYSLAVLLVMWPFGLLRSPLALLIPFLGFQAAAAFGALGLIATRFVHTINNFSFVITGLFTPILLFSDTLFPVSELPEAIKRTAQVLPLYAPVHLARDLAAGRPPDHLAASLAYLLIVPPALCWLAVRTMSRRLIH